MIITLQANLILSPYLTTIEVDGICLQFSMIKITIFDINKLTKLDSITVIRKPTSDRELSNKKLVDHELK